MNLRKALLFMRDEPDPLAKLGGFLAALAAAGGVSLLVILLALLASIGGEGGGIATQVLTCGLVLQLFPYLLVCMAAGYLVVVARRVAAGADVVLPNWRDERPTTYMRWGLLTTLPLVAWLALLAGLRFWITFAALGSRTAPVWVWLLTALTLVLALAGLVLWIPPTVRYTLSGAFVAYFSRRTWTSMMRPPYASIWAQTATRCVLLLLGGVLGSMLVYALLAGMTMIAFRLGQMGGGPIGWLGGLAPLPVLVYVALAVTHLIGQAARLVSDYESQVDGAAASAESTPHPA